MENSQGVQIVHSSGNVQQTAVDGHLCNIDPVILRITAMRLYAARVLTLHYYCMLHREVSTRDQDVRAAHWRKQHKDLLRTFLGVGPSTMGCNQYRTERNTECKCNMLSGYQAQHMLRTISGLPVALSWKRPPERALSRLPLSQNSDSNHVSCKSMACQAQLKACFYNV